MYGGMSARGNGPAAPRILLVDDDRELLVPLAEQLRHDGFDVTTARDGEEALRRLDAAWPDLLIIDLLMPRMDGLEATQHIMTQNPRPILIVSSESRQGAASTLRALELGAIDFVTKPSSGIDLDMKNVRDELLSKIKMAAKVRVVRTAALHDPGLVLGMTRVELLPVSVRRLGISRHDQPGHRAVHTRLPRPSLLFTFPCLSYVAVISPKYQTFPVLSAAYQSCVFAARLPSARRSTSCTTVVLTAWMVFVACVTVTRSLRT